jgi:hypothetical protein
MPAALPFAPALPPLDIPELFGALPAIGVLPGGASLFGPLLEVPLPEVAGLAPFGFELAGAFGNGCVVGPLPKAGTPVAAPSSGAPQAAPSSVATLTGKMNDRERFMGSTSTSA